MELGFSSAAGHGEEQEYGPHEAYGILHGASLGSELLALTERRCGAAGLLPGKKSWVTLELQSQLPRLPGWRARERAFFGSVIENELLVADVLHEVLAARR
jgi:hypothetical protein